MAYLIKIIVKHFKINVVMKFDWKTFIVSVLSSIAAALAAAFGIH